LGQHQRAIEDYNQAIRLDPKYAGAYSNRGVAHSDLGRHQRAIEDFNQAIRLDPEYATAYNNRGIAFKKIGQLDRSCVDFWRACDLGACNSLRLEQKKGNCQYPGGSYFIDMDENELYISTDNYGRYKITSKKVAASIKPGSQGIYVIKRLKNRTYISTDKYGDFYIDPL
jgi:tetratricopeptide (TPR) repeat protein